MVIELQRCGDKTRGKQLALRQYRSTFAVRVYQLPLHRSLERLFQCIDRVDHALQYPQLLRAVTAQLVDVRLKDIFEVREHTLERFCTRYETGVALLTLRLCSAET